MALGTLSPSAKQYFWNIITGEPLAGGLVYTVTAGGVSPGNAIATYQDSALTVPNSNPIQLNGAGYCTIFLTPGQAYKYIVTDANGVIQWTQDGIGGVPSSSNNLDVLGTVGEAISAGQGVYLSDGSGGKTSGQYFKWDATNPYSSTLPQVGIAPFAISASTIGVIRLGGQVTGLSSLVIGSTYYVGASGALTATVPTTNLRVIGVADSTTSLILNPNPSAFPATSTVTTTGAQIALTLPSGFSDLVIFANNATLLTIQGIAAGHDGQRVTIFSLGAGQVDLANLSPSAAAANRLINGVTGTISLAAGSGRVSLIYDSTVARWRVVLHEQGAWITPTFAAGNFTGSGTQTWTLAAGDVAALAYRLSGRTVTVSFDLATTSVGGGAAPFLRIGNAAWGGFTAARMVETLGAVADNGAPAVAGLISVGLDTATAISINTNVNGGSNWTGSADATLTRGTITFDVL